MNHSCENNRTKKLVVLQSAVFAAIQRQDERQTGDNQKCRQLAWNRKCGRDKAPCFKVRAENQLVDMN